MRTVEEYRSEVLSAVRQLPARTVSVGGADGLTLHDSVHALLDIPVFDNSAMDGFAVRFTDVSGAATDQPVTLRVVGDVPAGSALDPSLGSGECIRIMTGAPMPTDADTVVPFESTVGGLADSLASATVVVAPAGRGAYVRRAADDVRAGDVLLTAGTRLGPFQLAAVAAAGVDSVVVTRAPRVAVIATGSELVAAGSPLSRGQIPESNGTLLAAIAREAGAEVIGTQTVDDDGPGLQRAVARFVDGGEPADVIMFSGGVSAGAFEVVRNELAGSMTFTSVAMQPGKPQGFGVLPNGTLLFGLPGNPVSSAVSCEVFVRPVLLAMQGRTVLERPRLRLPASISWRSPAGRRQYVPAILRHNDDSTWHVAPATEGHSGSHLAGGLGLAHALAVVPADVEGVFAGDLVDVILLTGWVA